jgi:putative restriction endonuclease
MSLARYEEEFRRLVVNVRNDRASPHKICMLLAVLDLARAGALTANCIEFNPGLLERYFAFFAAVRGKNDHPNPYFPFFHLAGKLRGGGASFWHLKALPGRESVLDAMSTARSMSDVTSNIACAELDPELFKLLQNPRSIDALTEAISSHWLDRGLQDLRAVVAASSQVSSYENLLRSGSELKAREGPPPEYVRDPAFRRVVTQVYDFRCAATGVRIVLPTGESMVEAAHIHPFSEAGDDDPRNGLALTPNMHWAMDRNLIAPGPDYRWHVSATLDERIADYGMLLAIAGKSLFLPTEVRHAPKREALEWRIARLR